MTDNIIQSLKIDSDFRDLIPPLSDEEFQRLEKSIVNNGWEGWRGPIVVWDNTIIDGHNRYRICQKHGIAFTVKKMDFRDKDEAKLYIIDNQLKRRNLPLAAIGDLKLEEKAIVARQAKERQRTSTGGATPQLRPNLAQAENSGKTLEILARDIQMGRESLRKLDVIKQRAKEGDPVAISEREALISGKKKSIHGSYVKVVGKERSRSPQEATSKDGRRICVMCGEPINEGDALPSRPTVHKKCEKEYQRDWVNEQRDNADQDLLSNVAVFTFETLMAELDSSAKKLTEAWTQSITINESMGVRLTDQQKERLDSAVLDLFKAMNDVRRG